MLGLDEFCFVKMFKSTKPMRKRCNDINITFSFHVISHGKGMPKQAQTLTSDIDCSLHIFQERRSSQHERYDQTLALTEIKMP